MVPFSGTNMLFSPINYIGQLTRILVDCNDRFFFLVVGKKASLYKGKNQAICHSSQQVRTIGISQISVGSGKK